MEVMTLFLLTLPSVWCMPAEWSQWSGVASQDGSAPPGGGGDIVDDVIDGLLDDGGPLDDDGGLGRRRRSLGSHGGAALATMAGIAATSGLIKAGIITTGMVTTGLFGAGSWFEDHDDGVLLQNGRLDKGEELTPKNGKFKLLMQEDGNLVISQEEGGVLWSTNTVGSGSYFLFQEDGDLVVYDGGSSNKALWNSGTGGQGGMKLVLTEEGFLALHGSSGQIIWKSRPHTLLVNQMLHSGYSMASSNGNYKLSMQGDGDLVLYDISGDQGVVTWRTGPSNLKFHAYVMLQIDGNLVLRDEVHLPQWETMTKGSGATSLVLQDDGKLVLCCSEDGSPIWTNAPDNQGISGMKANGLKAHEIKDQGVKSGLMKASLKSHKIKDPLGSLKPHDGVKAPLKPHDKIDSLMLPGKKPFGPGHEPLGNLPLGAKSQGMKYETVKPHEITSQVVNSGEMKSEAVKPHEITSQVVNSGEMKSEELKERGERVLNGWSVWSDFTVCSATCGPATKMRERTCSDPANAELACQGQSAEIFTCGLPSCVDDGAWSAWIDVNECSATCGSATRMRRRTCSDSNGGFNCLGSSEETVDCNLDDCGEAHHSLVVDGGWSAWSDLTTCSASCGRATKMRVRTCSDPEPSNGGVMCQGLTEEIEDCNLDDCQAISGGWSVWSEFGECSATCGSATKRRERTCTNPEPSDESLMCQGPKEDIIDCGLADCPIHGGWSDWSDFGECSATCGYATKRMVRTCINPESSDESLMCQGPKEYINDCGLADCPIRIVGGWSAWSDLTTCSASCGRATKIRARTCSYPEPYNGGIMCQGLTEEIQDCNLDDCQVVSGGWSAWSDFSTCTATCGEATKRRERTCTNPEPSDESLMCQGPKEDLIDCGLDDCPIDVWWSAWSDFSTCTATCGHATKRMVRTCTNPEPSDEGLMCQGPKEVVIDCGLADCPIDGGWSAWSDFSTCSATCGEATKSRERTCTNPEPSNGGLVCPGLNEEIESCNLLNCGVFGEWSTWSCC